MVPGWLTTVSARRAVAGAPAGASIARSARMTGAIVDSLYAYVLPPIVGASSSGRSPALFASSRLGRYGCASALSVQGSGSRPKTPAGAALQSAVKPAAATARRFAAFAKRPPPRNDVGFGRP